MRIAPLLAALLLAGCGERPQAHPAGREIEIRFEVLENLPAEEGFRALLTLTHRGSVELAGSGWQLHFNFVPAIDPASLAAGVRGTRVNGDLWRLEPEAGFEPIVAGESRRIPFAGSGSVSKASDAPAGFYFVWAGDGEAEAVTGTTVASIATAPDVRVPTPADRQRANRALRRLDAGDVGAIVPTPVRSRLGRGLVRIDGSWRIAHGAGLAGEAAYLAEALAARLGSPLALVDDGPGGAGKISLRLGTEVAGRSSMARGDEAYRLVIDRRSGIEIVGSDPAGVFYGVQSLRALLPAAGDVQDAVELPEATVEDAPRFAYRGIHLDVARNFQPRAAVEKLLEVASFYKLNRFHFHLSDDEGWRLAVAGLPELTEVGGRRGHSVGGAEWLPPSFGSGPDPGRAPGSGHYARSDLVAILRYARERHIEVVPEIDLPGHARAAIRSMEARSDRLLAASRTEAASEFRLRDPQDTSRYRSIQGWDDNVVNVCLPSTYRFVERVVDELVSIWAEAGAPLAAIHTGGDEVPHGVWERSPACARLIRESPELDSVADLPGYFLRHVTSLLAERGLATAGWEEIALVEEERGGRPIKRPNPDLIDRGLQPYVWNNVWGWGSEDVGYRLANAGYPVVLANATNLYFDLAYDAHPLEPGYTWAGTVDTRKAWEMLPLDIYRTAREDRRGWPIDPAAFAGKERLTAAGRQRIRGIQGQIWGENAKSPALMEYLAFPKLLGLAERAWAAPPAWAAIEDPEERARRTQEAWNEFANRLGQRELPRLDRLAGGVAYRLPPPGATIVEGRLEASTTYPGLEIRYTTDGAEPTATSTLYTGPVKTAGTIRLASFDTRGRASRVVTVD